MEVITKESAVSQKHTIFFLDWALLDIVIIVILVIIPRPSSTSFQTVCLKLVGSSHYSGKLPLLVVTPEPPRGYPEPPRGYTEPPRG